MISEIYILFFKASLTIHHTATLSQKKSGTSKKIQWDFQISRVGSLDFLDLKVNGSPGLPLNRFFFFKQSSDSFVCRSNERKKECKSVKLLFFFSMFMLLKSQMSAIKYVFFSSLISRIRKSVVRCCLQYPISFSPFNER